jgi:uncharacterized protein (DUF2147 family)
VRPFLTLFALIAFAVPAASAETSAVGVWLRENGASQVRIAPCGDALCGKVVWASPRGQREVAKTTPRVVGTTVLTDVRPTAKGWSGRLFIPDDNIHVSASLQLLDDRTLKLTGCALFGLICRSQIWTRTEETADLRR